MTGELLTVKEYAARQGMTEQAAYKQIRAGKLTTVERRENGKPKKYIFCPVDPEEAAAAPAPDPRIEEPAEREQPPRPDDQTAAALEKAVAALSAQLEEKDRQINRLTELLNQSQQLQAHSQKLLEQGAQQPQEAQEEPPSGSQAVERDNEEAQAPRPEQPKKRGFWAWLFGE